MRSGAQPPIGSTWHLGSVSEPRPPVGCSPRVRPFPPRPPPEVAFLCSIASSVLRPHPTSHPRTYSAYGYCPREQNLVHHSGSGWLARPSLWGTCTFYSCQLSWRTLLGVIFNRRIPSPLATAYPPIASVPVECRRRSLRR